MTPHLVTGGILALSLLGDVEAEVLQQEDGSGGGIGARGFHLRTHTVLQEGDISAESEETGFFILSSIAGCIWLIFMLKI